MPGRDTRTRWQGVFARHQEGCGVERLAPGSGLGAIARACTCRPSYYGKAYDRTAGRHVATRRSPDIASARGTRKGLLEALGKGELPHERPLRLRDAHERFIAACREGRALNKHGRRYKRTAWEDIDECLRKHELPRYGARRVEDLRRSDVQRLVDELAPKMSGSRVRSIVNALRSLYRWAQDRELVTSDPAARVRLPAMNATPRNRVATPAEFAALLAALELEDALPYALAGYAMGRLAQIQRLRWREVDLRVGAIEWGLQEEARKSAAARRVVPTVRPLLALLKRAWIKQGRPDREELVCPPRRRRPDGLLHGGGLAARANQRWEENGLEPIGLHECRHTAATWLDAAGVSPKVASVLMGHAVPDHQPGAASITLARYTHTLPDAVETARRQLNQWLEQQLAAGASSAEPRSE
jgi:integrase